MTIQTKTWDSVERRYVDRDTGAEETFGALPEMQQQGFFAGLSELQRREALAYRGPENHGGRHGNFMQTYSGRKFWPLDPRAEDVCIQDIAHSLAMQCRYAGHCIRFYSVAEHSVLIARWLLDEGCGSDVALCGLLHDATEAYLVDLPRPVKSDMPRYKAAEARVWCAIADAFHIPEYVPAIVHEADNRILADEVAQNMRWMPWHN